nr:MAG: transcription elongation factor Elf1 [uncultured archaeon]
MPSENNDLMLNDIYFRRYIQANIARKYGYSAGYISQIKTKFKQLKNKPKIEDGRLVCYKCGNKDHLEFHYNRSTGELIILVCHSCNLKIQYNEIEHISNEVSEVNTELLDKFVLLMIKARIDSEDYGINIEESEISGSINRLKKRGDI